MNPPLLRSTPSQCRPGLIPYRFGAASKPRFNQLWFGISWGITKPDSFIFSFSPKFGRTGSGYFFCKWQLTQNICQNWSNSSIYVSTDEQYELLSITFTRCAIGSPHLNLSFSILSSSGSSLKENRSKCSIRDRKKSWHKPGRVDTNHEELLVTLHSFQ